MSKTHPTSAKPGPVQLYPRPRLQELREASGLTQRSLARELAVDVGTVRAYERGKRAIPDAHRSGLGCLFGVSVEHLMGVA